MATKVTLNWHKPDFDGEARKKMSEAVNEVRNTTIDVLSQPGTGRTYTHHFFTDAQGRLRRGKERWKPHTASAPGKPPARDTSELVQSIKYTIEGKGKTIIGKVGTDTIQGKMMEFGTRRVAPRPWLRKSFEKAEGKVRTILGRRWF